MSRLLDDDMQLITQMVKGYFFDDDQTRAAMRNVYEKTGYVLCPHTAVAYLGLKQYMEEESRLLSGVVLSTAHPAKFLDLVEETLGEKISIPENLGKLLSKRKEAVKMSARFADFKSWLLYS